MSNLDIEGFVSGIGTDLSSTGTILTLLAAVEHSLSVAQESIAQIVKSSEALDSELKLKLFDLVGLFSDRFSKKVAEILPERNITNGRKIRVDNPGSDA